MGIDARIGKLSSGKFYCFPDGYDKAEVIGTLSEIEKILGINSNEIASSEKTFKTWIVRLKFQYPAWDEKEGLLYRIVGAKSKTEAIAQVRKLARNDGHTTSGKGRYWFSATDDSE